MTNAKNTNQVTKRPTIQLSYGNVRLNNKHVVNAPKANNIAVACNELVELVKQGVQVDNLTMFGHKANCKGGIIDNTIFSGNVHSLESFISDLSNSGLKVVENDRTTYKPTAFKAVLAKRVIDHVKWCASTANNSHGGFGSRLAKVGLAGIRDEIAQKLGALAVQLENVYKVQYAPTYNSRKKLMV